MKPAKGLLQFATWLMRLAVAFFVFINFVGIIRNFDFKSIQFYVALTYVIFGLLLFIGGFMSKPRITVFSGLILFLASVYQIVMLYSDRADKTIAIYHSFVIYFMVATISLYFFTAGNKN
jgi:hypothetical protein